MADYHSSGIWVIETTLGFRHGMVSYEVLGLPDDLKGKFEKWIETYNTRLHNQSFDIKEFEHKGLELAKELKSFVGPSIYVEYNPEESDFGVAMEEVIQRELAKEGTVKLMGIKIIDSIDYFIRSMLKRDYDSRFGKKMDEIMSRPDIIKELESLKDKLTKTVEVH